MIEGILYSVQYLIITRDEPSMAQELIRDSGYTMNDFLKIQRKSGYESRKMNKVIREAFK